MKNRICALVAVFSVLAAASQARSDTLPKDIINLQQAMDHAVQHSPALAAYNLQVEADTVRLEGHEGFPNPEISLDLEDFGGSGVAKEADSMQVTTSLTQGIPLANKTGALRQVSKARQAVSSLELQIARQALMADVSTAFLNVLAHQRRLDNALEMVELAEKTVETIRIQADAGKASGMEVDKAAVVLSLARLDSHRVERDLAMVRQHLAMICGESAPFFESVAGTLDNVQNLPDLNEILAGIETHPALMASAAQVRHQQAVLEQEKADLAPDLSLSVGYRYMNATKDSAVVAGISVPLPIIDRRQGRIAAATLEARKAVSESDQEHLSLVRALTDAFNQLSAEHERAAVLKNDVYPRVLETYNTVTEGYRIGRFGYLDLLDAQRTLFQVKEMALDALVFYHRAAILLQQTAAMDVSASRFDTEDAGQGEI